MNRDQRRGRRGLRSIHKLVCRIDRCGPDVLEHILRVTLLQHDADRSSRSREAKRLLKRALRRLRFVSRFPLSVDRCEPAGVQQLLRLQIADLEQILAEVRRVNRLRRIAGPWQRLNHHAVDTEDLLRRITRVVVIHAHRRRRGG